MDKDIKVYIRSDRKAYFYMEGKIYFYEEKDLNSIFENFKEENGLEGKITVSLILHFSYVKFEDDLKERRNFIEKEFKYINKRYYLNYTEDRYMSLYMVRKEISTLRRILRKLDFIVSDIKIDFDIIYNFYRSEDIEILQIGEKESLRISVQDEKIYEIEKVEIKLSDILEDINNFDFGNMKTVFCKEEDLQIIFSEDNFNAGMDLLNKKPENPLKELKNIKLSEIGIIIGTVILYFYIGGLIPLEKIRKENNEIKMETKNMEESYLKKKKEKLPDYSEELSKLTEIDNGIKRKEYYSTIKFLVSSSKLGIDYTKINYEGKKWTIQGEVADFKNLEKFEENMENKYGNIELGYIKDNDVATVFEYILNE